jgi:hypothetical protein
MIFILLFRKGYLNLVIQEHCLLNLCHVREFEIYIRISLAHLEVSGRRLK